MGKIFTQQIDRFDGGMTDELRSKDFSKSAVIKHFDAFSYKGKLVPRQSSEKLAGEDKDKKIIRMIYAQDGTDPSVFSIWGFGGTASNLAAARPYQTGIDAWGIATGISGIARDAHIFFFYKDWIYMFYDTKTELGRFSVRTDAWENAHASWSPDYVNYAQPVHHPADDIAYFFTDNNVHKQIDNAAGWTADILTLPSNYKITCATPFGDYLAIGTAPLSGFGNSIVYQWDRDSSLSTVSAKYDFGLGNIKHLAVLDGKLIGVVERVGSTSPVEGSVLIRQAVGNSSRILNRFVSDVTTDPLIPDTRVIKDNRLYFPMKLELNGDTRFGIWAINSDGGAAIDYIENEATSYEHIFPVDDSWLICHSGDKSTNASFSSFFGTQTGSKFSTTLSSVYETLIIDGNDASKTKKLLGVTVKTEPLPTAGQVVLKYRKNEDTSWTTIFTHTTDNSISHSAINIETGGANLPSYKEIQFQINSTGGATITGIKWKWEEISDDIY